ncbi:GTP 3',8-cyclase MoaA [Bogoriella caseilytica]|uniref:GTP 3',8-cyclase n=1 Tax=Bogoriella caseilytica TaxID=56055 RepID=A0A3N2BF00_9MICO|nr:GTP 3',8-cyclase MoaA [Bogoriella caseilytica]ROR73770.1 cyclic pyranopterin monophosphate synthase subunit MoaA [Bogoriella caseilytica]
MPVVGLGLPRVRRRRAGLGDETALRASGGSGDGVRGAPSPAVAGLRDSYGRVATDLRVSLTDRCNLRCDYCMPAEGMDWMPSPQVLSDDEIIRLIGLAVQQLGVRELRFTGGEPLLRKGLERIIGATTALRTVDGEVPQTSLTTNALGLQRRAEGLVRAGLRRINVSLDAVDRATFASVTRRDRLPDVLAGIHAAAAAGLRPIKINAVLLRGVNDHQAGDLLAWALRHGYELRFIEQMPLGPPRAWQRGDMVTAAEVLDRLSERFTLRTRDPAERGSAPAQRWTVEPSHGAPGGTVGIIASVSEPFCAACDRTRLTADGQIRNCLFAAGETDLRGMLRGGASNEELAEVWRVAMWGKAAGHGIDDPSFLPPARTMSAIGG